MFPICYICLRSDVKFRKLGTLPQDQPELISFCDQLCDYNFEDFFYQFCPECISKLKKCLDFKKRCKLASDVLKSWKETLASDKASVSLNELHKCMPSPLSHLSFCDGKNFKTFQYIYQDPKSLPVSKSTSKDVHSYSQNGKAKSANRSTNKHTNILSKANKIDATHNIRDKEISVTEIDTSDTESLIENDTTDQISDIEDDTTDQICDIENGMTEQVSVIENDTTNYISNKENYTEDENSTFEYDSTEEITITEDNTVNVQDVIDNSDVLRIIEHDHMYYDKNDINKEELKDIDSDTSTNEIIEKIERNREEVKSLISVITNPDEKKVFIDMEVLKCQFKHKFSIEKEKAEIEKQARIREGLKKYENFFEITIFTNRKQMKEEFKNRKNYPSYIDSNHRCEKCLIGFKTAKRLENHINIRHKEPLPFSCEICQCYLSSRKMLSIHIKAYHSLVFQCKECPNFVTSFKGYMIGHYSKHVGDVLTCNICLRQFQSQSAYYAHVNNAHESDHVCGYCAAVYSNEVKLKMHIKRQHSGEEFIESPENRKCEVCNIVFINSHIYSKHMQRKHKESYQKEIVRTKRKPTRVPVTCPLCNKEGFMGIWLYNHCKANHPGVSYDDEFSVKKNHLCDVCGRRFKHATNLREHKFEHTGEKPYGCDKCPAKFRAKHLLKIHSDRHEPRSHVCQQCGKGFKTANNLFYHMRIHKNDRRFKCHICDKGFIHNALLKEHISGVHLKIRRQKKRKAVDTEMIPPKKTKLQNNMSEDTCF